MTDSSKIHMVTGAFGYSGKYIAAELLNKGHNVHTITYSVNRENPFGDKVKVHPFNFENPDKLAESLKGVSVLYNTYWVRFNHSLFKHADAVKNTITLFNAAKKAGVERIVHVSITNPSADSELEYFKGKAILEKALIDSGMSYSILRPAVLFGKEDILINNIAWMIRHFPVFGVFGDGSYKLQPIYIEDLADLAVKEGESRENHIINAIGPETFTYRELVLKIEELIGIQRPIISIPPFLGYILSKIMSRFVGDVIITREEIKGLMENTLVVDAPPAGETRLSEWIKANSASIGRVYTSELARRIDRKGKYKSN